MSLSAEQEISSLFVLFDLNADGEITPKEVDQMLMAQKRLNGGLINAVHHLNRPSAPTPYRQASGTPPGREPAPAPA